MEPMDDSLLFRWFVGLNIDDPVWDHSTFSFNRDRLFDDEIAQTFFAHTVLLARVNDLVSDEHFSVDGTLLEAWASHKSFRPKDGSGGDGADFHRQTRSNDTHASTTDPETRNTNGSGGSARGNGYAMSLHVRQRIEQGLGRVKTTNGWRKLPRVGLETVRGWVAWNFAAYNLIRLCGIGDWWDSSSI